MENLSKCSANYAPLSPLTFLERAAGVYADRSSVVYEGRSFTWRETHGRCRRLASSLLSLGIARRDVVSVLSPNVPALYEMHFAVPMAGAVLNAINARLDARSVATILSHSEAKVFFVDFQYVPLAREALGYLIGGRGCSDGSGRAAMPLVVVIDDIGKPTGVRLGELEYEQLVQRGDPRRALPPLEDECEPIALNYTSGTTSAPKGVVYSHRGAYLSTISLVLQWEMRSEPVYLWTLPMFHCNGWTFTWGVAARGGTNVMLRSPTGAAIYRSIVDHQVTHMCCAPVIFSFIIEARPEERRPIATPVEVLTGGAPPPAALLEKMGALGFHVTHAYGLTEATGPALVCEWQSQWNVLSTLDQARLKARQGISVLSLAGADVKDPVTMKSVARDGREMGEIVLRGSSVMKGYYKDPAATAEAFRGGWFHTGDMAVVHPDGYVEIKDRSKDVIISGGENISSVEVEAVLYSHPMVSEAAVVAMPHLRWGETPCAFVTLKKQQQASSQGDRTMIENDDKEIAAQEEEIIVFCRKNMTHFMAPKKVVFLEELPKTSTGKIQKFQLRSLAKEMVDLEKTSHRPFSWRPSSSSQPKAQQRSHLPVGGKPRFEPQEQQPPVLAMSRL